MSDKPQGSSSSTPAAARPLIVGSTIVKPEPASTKPKMLFKPVVPIRKKKEESAAPSASTSASTPSTSRASTPSTRGQPGARGRGGAARGGASGGRGGGSFGASTMVASGPFAQGPGANKRPSAAIVRSGPAGSTSGPAQGSSSALSNYKLPEDRKADVELDEQYSDQDAGVEVVDMANLGSLDVMAPRGLPKQVDRRKLKTKKKSDLARVKTEDGSDEDDAGMDASSKGKGRARVNDPLLRLGMDDEEEEDEKKEVVNLGQAVDLSESEEEEEEADIRGDFIGWEGKPVPPNQLSFFQFPRQFPQFTPLSSSPNAMDVDGAEEAAAPKPRAKKEAVDSKVPPSAAPKPEGQIGTLLITKSGKVKMRLGDDILLDVSPGSQLDFLQHFVHIDTSSHRVTPISDVKRRFVVTPDVDELLHLLAFKGDDVKPVSAPTKEGEGELRQMVMSDEDE